MVTLIQLEYIIALDTYRHFVTASEKCFVTQPTLSMQVKKMEEFLGVIIFDRTKHPLIPTEIGVKIIEQARIILSESKKIGEIIQNENNTVSGELHIGIIPSLAPYLLPLFIGNFIKKYPDVKIIVTELLTEEIVSQLKKDTLDVGILVTPLDEKGIIETPLFYEKMLIFANKNHEIASFEKINTKELSSPDLWLLSNGHCFRSQVINLCNLTKNINQNTHFQYESGSLETIKKLVEIEGGFTLIPELAAMKFEKNTKTTLKYFSNSRPLREVSFAFTRNYTKKRILNSLSEEIKNSIPKTMLSSKDGNIIKWRN